MQGIRKVHSAWDKANSAFSALVKKSAEHPNTTGCKFEKDLETIRVKGHAIDRVLQQLEEKFLTGANFDDDDIRAGASQAAAMTIKIKEGKKKAGALRPWFKL